MLDRSHTNWWIFYRGLSLGLALLLSLPTPDLWAAPSSRSIFAGKQAAHTAVQQRNLRELDAKQGMLGKEKPSTVHGPQSTATPTPLSLSALQDLAALSIPTEDGQILEVWQPEETVAGRTSQVVEQDPHDLRPPTSDAARGPSVLLLQDLHTQPEAQQAEGRILEHLYKTYRLTSVASEGATGPFQLAFFQQFPKDPRLRALLAETFLQAGELTGHEYQAITQRLPITIEGVEDPDLYVQNGQAFVQVLDAAPPAQQALAELQQRLEALKATLYPAPLQRWEQQHHRFQAGEVPLPDYAASLLASAREQQFDVASLALNVARFVQLQQQEAALDRAQLEPQLQQLLAVLTNQLPGGFSTPPPSPLGLRSNKNGNGADAPSRGAHALASSSSEAEGRVEKLPHDRDAFSTRSARSNEKTDSSSSAVSGANGVEKLPQEVGQARRELDELLAQFQHGAIAPARFYPQLLALAQQDGIDLAAYPQLTAFASYLQQSAQLQQHRLLPELEALQLAVAEQLADSVGAKTLVQLSHRARLLQDLLALKLTPDQWAVYQQQRSEDAVATITAFLQRHGQAESAWHFLEEVPGTVELAERFYTLAHQRDRVLCERTLRWIQEASIVHSPQSTAAPGPSTVDRGRFADQATPAVLLIAGGFHTPGITAQLRERQIPYVVITPTASGALDEALYHRLVRGQTATLAGLVGQAQAVARAKPQRFRVASRGLQVPDANLAQAGPLFSRHALKWVAAALLLGVLLLGMPADAIASEAHTAMTSVDPSAADALSQMTGMLTPGDSAHVASQLQAALDGASVSVPADATGVALPVTPSDDLQAATDANLLEMAGDGVKLATLLPKDLKQFELWIRNARKSSNERNHEKAVSAYREALALNDSLPALWAEYGHELLLLKREEEAEVAYRQGIEKGIRAAEPEALSVLYEGLATAIFYKKGGDVTAAMEAMAQGAEQVQLAIVNMQRGSTSASLGSERLRGLLLDKQKALLDKLSALAQQVFQRGESALADQALRAALDKLEDKTTSGIELARFYIVSGRLELAKNELDLVQDRCEQSGPFWFYKALHAQYSNDPTAQFEALTKAKTLLTTPGRLRGQTLVDWARVRLKQFSSTIPEAEAEEIARCLRRGIDDLKSAQQFQLLPGYFYDLGLTYMVSQQPQKGIESYRDAVQYALAEEPATGVTRQPPLPVNQIIQHVAVWVERAAEARSGSDSAFESWRNSVGQGLVGLALAMVQNRQDDQAAEVSRQIVAISDGSINGATMFVEAAGCLTRSGRPDEAKQMLEQALVEQSGRSSVDTAPASVEVGRACYMLAYEQLERGEIAEARQTFEQAERVMSDVLRDAGQHSYVTRNGDGAYLLGVAQMELGKIKEALASLKASEDAGRDLADISQCLMIAKFRTVDSQGAMASLSQAIQRDADTAPLFENVVRHATRSELSQCLEMVLASTPATLRGDPLPLPERFIEQLKTGRGDEKAVLLLSDTLGEVTRQDVVNALIGLATNPGAAQVPAIRLLTVLAERGDDAVAEALAKVLFAEARALPEKLDKIGEKFGQDRKTGTQAKKAAKQKTTPQPVLTDQEQQEQQEKDKAAETLVAAAQVLAQLDAPHAKMVLMWLDAQQPIKDRSQAIREILGAQKDLQTAAGRQATQAIWSRRFPNLGTDPGKKVTVALHDRFAEQLFEKKKRAVVVELAEALLAGKTQEECLALCREIVTTVAYGTFRGQHGKAFGEGLVKTSIARYLTTQSGGMDELQKSLLEEAALGAVWDENQATIYIIGTDAASELMDHVLEQHTASAVPNMLDQAAIEHLARALGISEAFAQWLVGEAKRGTSTYTDFLYEAMLPEHARDLADRELTASLKAFLAMESPRRLVAPGEIDQLWLRFVSYLLRETGRGLSWSSEIEEGLFIGVTIPGNYRTAWGLLNKVAESELGGDQVQTLTRRLKSFLPAVLRHETPSTMTGRHEQTGDQLAEGMIGQQWKGALPKGLSHAVGDLMQRKFGFQQDAVDAAIKGATSYDAFLIALWKPGAHADPEIDAEFVGFLKSRTPSRTRIDDPEGWRRSIWTQFVRQAIRQRAQALPDAGRIQLLLGDQMPKRLGTPWAVFGYLEKEGVGGQPLGELGSRLAACLGPDAASVAVAESTVDWLWIGSLPPMLRGVVRAQFLRRFEGIEPSIIDKDILAARDYDEFMRLALLPARYQPGSDDGGLNRKLSRFLRALRSEEEGKPIRVEKLDDYAVSLWFEFAKSFVAEETQDAGVLRLASYRDYNSINEFLRTVEKNKPDARSLLRRLQRFLPQEERRAHRVAAVIKGKESWPVLAGKLKALGLNEFQVRTILESTYWTADGQVYTWSLKVQQALADGLSELLDREVKPEEMEAAILNEERVHRRANREVTEKAHQHLIEIFGGKDRGGEDRLNEVLDGLARMYGYPLGTAREELMDELIAKVYFEHQFRKGSEELHPLRLLDMEGEPFSLDEEATRYLLEVAEGLLQVAADEQIDVIRVDEQALGAGWAALEAYAPRLQGLTGVESLRLERLPSGMWLIEHVPGVLLPDGRINAVAAVVAMVRECAEQLTGGRRGMIGTWSARLFVASVEYDCITWLLDHGDRTSRPFRRKMTNQRRRELEQRLVALEIALFRDVAPERRLTALLARASGVKAGQDPYEFREAGLRARVTVRRGQQQSSVRMRITGADGWIPAGLVGRAVQLVRVTRGAHTVSESGRIGKDGVVAFGFNTVPAGDDAFSFHLVPEVPGLEEAVDRIIAEVDSRRLANLLAKPENMIPLDKPYQHFTDIGLDVTISTIWEVDGVLIKRRIVDVRIVNDKGAVPEHLVGRSLQLLNDTGAPIGGSRPIGHDGKVLFYEVPQGLGAVRLHLVSEEQTGRYPLVDTIATEIVESRKGLSREQVRSLVYDDLEPPAAGLNGYWLRPGSENLGLPGEGSDGAIEWSPWENSSVGRIIIRLPADRAHDAEALGLRRVCLTDGMQVVAIGYLVVEDHPDDELLPITVRPTWLWQREPGGRGVDQDGLWLWVNEERVDEAAITTELKEALLLDDAETVVDAAIAAPESITTTDALDSSVREAARRLGATPNGRGLVVVEVARRQLNPGTIARIRKILGLLGLSAAFLAFTTLDQSALDLLAQAQQLLEGAALEPSQLAHLHGLLETAAQQIRDGATVSHEWLRDVGQAVQELRAAADLVNPEAVQRAAEHLEQVLQPLAPPVAELPLTTTVDITAVTPPVSAATDALFAAALPLTQIGQGFRIDQRLEVMVRSIERGRLWLAITDISSTPSASVVMRERPSGNPISTASKTRTREWVVDEKTLKAAKGQDVQLNVVLIPPGAAATYQVSMVVTRTGSMFNRQWNIAFGVADGPTPNVEPFSADEPSLSTAPASATTDQLPTIKPEQVVERVQKLLDQTVESPLDLNPGDQRTFEDEEVRVVVGASPVGGAYTPVIYVDSSGALGGVEVGRRYDLEIFVDAKDPANRSVIREALPGKTLTVQAEGQPAPVQLTFVESRGTYQLARGVVCARQTGLVPLSTGIKKLRVQLIVGALTMLVLSSLVLASAAPGMAELSAFNAEQITQLLEALQHPSPELWAKLAALDPAVAEQLRALVEANPEQLRDVVAGVLNSMHGATLSADFTLTQTQMGDLLQAIFDRVDGGQTAQAALDAVVNRLFGVAPADAPLLTDAANKLGTVGAMALQGWNGWPGWKLEKHDEEKGYYDLEFAGLEVGQQVDDYQTRLVNFAALLPKQAELLRISVTWPFGQGSPRQRFQQIPVGTRLRYPDTAEVNRLLVDLRRQFPGIPSAEVEPVSKKLSPAAVVDLLANGKLLYAEGDEIHGHDVSVHLCGLVALVLGGPEAVAVVRQQAVALRRMQQLAQEIHSRSLASGVDGQTGVQRAAAEIVLQRFNEEYGLPQVATSLWETPTFRLTMAATAGVERFGPTPAIQAVYPAFLSGLQSYNESARQVAQQVLDGTLEWSKWFAFSGDKEGQRQRIEKAFKSVIEEAGAAVIDAKMAQRVAVRMMARLAGNDRDWREVTAAVEQAVAAKTKASQTSALVIHAADFQALWDSLLSAGSGDDALRRQRAQATCRSVLTQQLRAYTRNGKPHGVGVDQVYIVVESVEQREAIEEMQLMLPSTVRVVEMEELQKAATGGVGLLFWRDPALYGSTFAGAGWSVYTVGLGVQGENALSTLADQFDIYRYYVGDERMTTFLGAQQALPTSAGVRGSRVLTMLVASVGFVALLWVVGPPMWAWLSQQAGGAPEFSGAGLFLSLKDLKDWDTSLLRWGLGLPTGRSGEGSRGETWDQLHIIAEAPQDDETSDAWINTARKLQNVSWKALLSHRIRGKIHAVVDAPDARRRLESVREQAQALQATPTYRDEMYHIIDRVEGLLQELKENPSPAVLIRIDAFQAAFMGPDGNVESTYLALLRITERWADRKGASISQSLERMCEEATPYRQALEAILKQPGLGATEQDPLGPLPGVVAAIDWYKHRLYTLTHRRREIVHDAPVEADQFSDAHRSFWWVRYGIEVKAATKAVIAGLALLVLGFLFYEAIELLQEAQRVAEGMDATSELAKQLTDAQQAVEAAQQGGDAEALQQAAKRLQTLLDQSPQHLVVNAAVDSSQTLPLPTATPAAAAVAAQAVLPRTFPFPLSEKRREMLGRLTQDAPQPVSRQELLKLFQSDDLMLHEAGIYFLERNPDVLEAEALDNLAPRANHADPLVRAGMAKVLAAIGGELALPILQQRVREEQSPAVRRALAAALERVGTRDAMDAVDTLLASTAYDDSESRRAMARAKVALVQRVAVGASQNVAQALRNLFYQSEDGAVQVAVIRALGDHDDKETLTFLHRRAEELDYGITVAAAQAIVANGLRRDAASFSRELSGDSKFAVRWELVMALERGAAGSSVAVEVLETVSRDDAEESIRAAATVALQRVQSQITAGLPSVRQDALMVLQGEQPHTATPFLGELTAKLQQLEELARELRDRFGERFTGFVIVGGAAKGYYWGGRSDVDVAILAKDLEVFNAANDRLTSAFEVVNAGFGTTEMGTLDDWIRNSSQFLYAGLVVGDGPALRARQQEVLGTMSPEQWTEIVEVRYRLETLLDEAFKRFGIGDADQQRRLQLVAGLRSVPPPLEEARDALRVIDAREVLDATVARVQQAERHTTNEALKQSVGSLAHDALQRLRRLETDQRKALVNNVLVAHDGVRTLNAKQQRRVRVILAALLGISAAALFFAVVLPALGSEQATASAWPAASVTSGGSAPATRTGAKIPLWQVAWVTTADDVAQAGWTADQFRAALIGASPQDRSTPGPVYVLVQSMASDEAETLSRQEFQPITTEMLGGLVERVGTPGSGIRGLLFAGEHVERWLGYAPPSGMYLNRPLWELTIKDLMDFADQALDAKQIEEQMRLLKLLGTKA